MPLEWSPDEVAWTAELPGYGQSSPVCFGDRAYVTSVSGEQKERFHVSAWRLADGGHLWTRDVEAASRVEYSSYTSRAAPTPIVDDSGLVVFLESGDLVALDHAGEVVWKRNLVADHGPITARHGLASSLVRHGERVFVWVERETEPYVLAVDRGTGESLWKVAGPGATTWSTPALLPVEGDDEPHLVLSASGKLVGLRPSTGERLWTLGGLAGNTTQRPRPLAGGRLLVGAATGRGTEGEAAAAAAKTNGVVQVLRKDGAWAAEYVWRAERATSSFGSPIEHRGLVYFVNATGVLFCLDAATGEERYAERIAESVWATPLAVDDRIYFVGKSGTTTVVRAGPTFEVLAENRTWTAESPPKAAAETGEGGFSAPVQYAVVAVPGRLLIRRGDRLDCLAKETTPVAKEAAADE